MHLAAVVLIAGATSQSSVADLGFTNIGDGICTNGAWGGEWSPTVSRAAPWVYARYQWHTPEWSQWLQGSSSVDLACARYCVSLAGSCVGFNAFNTHCVIYSTAVGAVTAVVPTVLSNGNGGSNGTFDGVPCWKKELDNVAGVRYVAVTDDATWAVARERCQALGLGGDLASFADINELRTIYELVLQAGLRRAWLGLMDAAGNNRFAWTDGSGSLDSFDGPAWAAGYPQHASRGTNLDRDCGAITGKYLLSGSNSGPDNEPGALTNSFCDTLGVRQCLGTSGRGNGRAVPIGNFNNLQACFRHVDALHGDATGVTFDPATGLCKAQYNMTGVITTGCTACYESLQNCVFHDIPGETGFVCGIPTGLTASPTVGAPSSPSSPPTAGPSPWYEHAGHQTNFSELQDRMTDAEQTARSAAASMSQMQATVSQILTSMAGVTGDVSRIRAALLQAVESVPDAPAPCAGAGCLAPAIAVDGTDLVVKALVGSIGITSEACVVDDLCSASSFASKLKEALRPI